jgi:1-acyl-sn-glycerol-3-phosphate acyltransferase
MAKTPASDDRTELWDDPSLSRFERFALATLGFANRNPTAKRLQHAFHQRFGNLWVSACIKNLLHTDGLEAAAALRPPAGVLLCANHRSFFDQYVIMSVLYRAAPWARRVFFPVRSNFFYETWAGLAVNFLAGGGAMYPPIYRQPARSALNKRSLDLVTELLAQPGVVVGMHPEGTRGKGPDPYQLLPAQPGVGQVIMRGRPTVVPVWVNGLSNDFFGQVVSNFRRDDRRGEPIILVFGAPVDFGDLLRGTPRPAQYKRVADRVREDLIRLGARERELRAALTRARDRV